VDEITILFSRWACALLWDDIPARLTLYAVCAELLLGVSELNPSDYAISDHVKEAVAVCVAHVLMKIHQGHLRC
jgi:hypothetical protein